MRRKMPNRSKLSNKLTTCMLEQLTMLAGANVTIDYIREKPWASITFSGTRYYFQIRSEHKTGPEGIETLAQQLPDHEFDVPGYFVADFLVRHKKETILDLEILAISDPVIAPVDSI